MAFCAVKNELLLLILHLTDPYMVFCRGGASHE